MSTEDPTISTDPPKKAEIVTPTQKRAAARALYETQVNVTFPDIAAQVDVPVKELRKWREEDAANGDPWRVARQWEAAKSRAELYAKKSGDLAGIIGPLKVEADDEARKISVATVAATAPAGTDETALIKARHREEWLAPRSLAYTAMKLGQAGRVEEALTLAKLAKTSAETITLVQAGEREAHGIKTGEESGIVVVERT